MFKAEKFDPDEWAELFKRAGAQFAGPVAEQLDGFAMWDSDLTKWDAADIGPQRDITGELARTIRKQDIRFVVSFHHAHNWRYYEPFYKGDYDTKNPEYASVHGLYPEPHEPGEQESEEFLKDWEAKAREVNEILINYALCGIQIEFTCHSQQSLCAARVPAIHSVFLWSTKSRSFRSFLE